MLYYCYAVFLGDCCRIWVLLRPRLMPWLQSHIDQWSAEKPDSQCFIQHLFLLNTKRIHLPNKLCRRILILLGPKSLVPWMAVLHGNLNGGLMFQLMPIVEPIWPKLLWPPSLMSKIWNWSIFWCAICLKRGQSSVCPIIELFSLSIHGDLIKWRWCDFQKMLPHEPCII